MALVPEAADIRRRIGARITAARGDRTLRDLADALKQSGTTVSPQAIYQWEQGQTSPTPDRQLALAKALGVPWAQLFHPDDEQVA